VFMGVTVTSKAKVRTGMPKYDHQPPHLGGHSGSKWRTPTDATDSVESGVTAWRAHPPEFRPPGAPVDGVPREGGSNR